MKKNQHDKYRSEEENNCLIKRLNIVEGQVKGIKQMVEKGRNCSDILIQISSVDKALKSLGEELVKSYLSKCIVEDIKNGSDDYVKEIMELFSKLS